MSKRLMYTVCSGCSERHYQVDVVNVEEDIYGRDKIYFVCPVAGTTESGLVYIDYDEDDQYE